MKGTAQLVQVLAAALAVSNRFHSAVDPKGPGGAKITTLEKFKFAFDLPQIFEAVEGIEEVPAEIQDLTNAELKELSVPVSALLTAWGISHRTQDITIGMMEEALELVPVVKDFVARIITMSKLPPSALPAA